MFTKLFAIVVVSVIFTITQAKHCIGPSSSCTPQKDDRNLQYQRACCMAYNSSCNACAAGMSEFQYCQENPAMAGCSKFQPMIQPRPMRRLQRCCRAANAKCLACAQGISVRRFCSQNMRVPGCYNVNMFRGGGVMRGY